MTKDEAHALLAAHDNYVKAIWRLPKAQLATLYRAELAKRGSELLYGGPASKDELTSAIVDLSYPLAQMNAARQVYYAPEPEPFDPTTGIFDLDSGERVG